MNHQRNLQVTTGPGKDLPKGWSLKTREKGGLLPQPVICKNMKLNNLFIPYNLGKKCFKRIV